MSESTADLSATAVLEAYRTGALSPVTATRDALDRIGGCNGSVNAVCHVDAESALTSAEGSAARWRADTPCGPLDGIPLSIKDTLVMAGWPTGRGSLVAADGPAISDCLPLVGVREAGAVFLGSTTTPELHWKGVNDSLRTVVTTNPWNAALTAGGSSGGAAAVALGMGQLSLGTDAAGSVRIPAACSTIWPSLSRGSGWAPTWPPSTLSTTF